MTELVDVEYDTWQPRVAPEATARLAHALESGGVLVFPRLPFVLQPSERRFLDVCWSDGRAKNISVDRDAVKGAAGTAEERAALRAMVSRFAAAAGNLVAAILPRYASHLTRARTSYRPHTATGRPVSWRKDDARLHVDAFPSRPNRGERILRVFSNVNPHGEDRVWRVGEPFEAMARRFLPRIRVPLPGEARVLHWLRVTRTRRSAYDHLMLRLHDAAKADLAYQRTCPQQQVRFAPGTTWVCFSDQVMHAAMGGQFMLEQTIHLPLGALYDPTRAPLAILERLAGRPLVRA